MKLTDSAPLITTGTLLGLVLPLGKIATPGGIPPAIWILSVFGECRDHSFRGSSPAR